MKSTAAAFFLFLLVHFQSTGQFGAAVGYTYLIDQTGGKEYQGEDQDNPYAQDQFSVGISYLVKGWEFGLSGTGLINRQNFYGTRTNEYHDVDMGGWSAKYHTTHLRTELEYRYAGLRLSVEKWFDFKSVSWLQLGVGLSQQLDFLQDYRQQNTQAQYISEETTYYEFMDSVSYFYQESEWQNSTMEAYSMRERFKYMGFDFGLRFRWKSLCFEPSFGVYFWGDLRTSSNYREFKEPPSFPRLFGYYGLPSYSFRFGYHFPAKKR